MDLPCAAHQKTVCTDAHRFFQWRVPEEYFTWDPVWPFKRSPPVDLMISSVTVLEMVFVTIWSRSFTSTCDCLNS